MAAHAIVAERVCVVADDHKGLRAAARRVFDATHQRSTLHEP
jgi:hypothetical protein